jgi:hypothetical protein
MTKLPIPGVTYDIFITAFMKDSVQAFIKKNELRQGQAFFNFLNTYNHDLANKIRGTELDPYYSIDIAPAVHDFLIKNWTVN